MNTVQRLRQLLQILIENVQSTWKQAKSIARDPVQIWELALTTVLSLNSHLFILPLSSSTDQDGKRTVRIPKSTGRRVLPCIFNAMFALRMGYLVSIAFDGHFRWLVQGQFTADVSVFVILILVMLMGLAIHFTFLARKEDFAFLSNSVLQLNTAFSCTSSYLLTVM